MYVLIGQNVVDCFNGPPHGNCTHFVKVTDHAMLCVITMFYLHNNPT